MRSLLQLRFRPADIADMGGDEGGRHSGGWGVPIGVAIALAALVVGLVAQAAAGQRAAIDEIDGRFRERTDFASSYVTAQLGDVRERQLNYARLQLSGATVGAEEFDRVATSFGFEASLLLDGDGVVLAVSPQKPSLVGTELASRYDHLAVAVSGSDAISNVVTSAAN